jgi:hypothetical protein
MRVEPSVLLFLWDDSVRRGAEPNKWSSVCWRLVPPLARTLTSAFPFLRELPRQCSPASRIGLGQQLARDRQDLDLGGAAAELVSALRRSRHRVARSAQGRRSTRAIRAAPGATREAVTYWQLAPSGRFR